MNTLIKRLKLTRIQYRLTTLGINRFPEEIWNKILTEVDFDQERAAGLLDSIDQSEREFLAFVDSLKREPAKDEPILIAGIVVGILFGIFLMFLIGLL